jgi:hypothetical protein
MRSSGVELFRYSSARDVDRGVNVGAFSPTVFGTAKPHGFQTWHCTATRERVEIAKGEYFERETFVFPRQQFLVGGTLPAPAL